MARKLGIAFGVVLLVFVSIATLFAGGLKEKIQQRIGTQKSNILNLNASDSLSKQFESGQYLEVDRIAGANEVKDLQEATSMDSSRLQPAGILSALSSYAIYKTDYKAELDEDVATVKGNVVFEVFRKGWTQIPLVSAGVGLIDSTINRGASYITMQGGRYYLMIDKPGRYSLQIEFLIKASREREGGPGSFGFEVMPAPISQFEFTMPEEDVDIFVEPAIKVETKRNANKTVAWAVMPNTNTITVRWTKAVKKEIISPVKLEPKVYVDSATYAAIGEGIVRCQASLNYNILQSEVSNMRLGLPEDVSILEVRGKDLRDWKISKEKGTQYLDVYLNFGVRGNYALNVIYERNIGDSSVVAEIPWIKAIGVEREKGFFGIASATNVELAVNKADNVNSVDVKELPSSVWNMSVNPILLAFKYTSHPFSIFIDVTKHEEVPVLIAAIDSAAYISLQTDEGKTLTKAVYQVRNNVKQFVHITLPKDSMLWSVFVAGKPVKPAKDKKGVILIPLEKSRLSGESLAQFPVEVVYLDKASKMGWLGGLKLTLPQTDIPVSSLVWSLYLPLDYLYYNLGGNVKELIPPVTMHKGWRQKEFEKRRGISKDEQWDREAKSESYLGAEKTVIYSGAEVSRFSQVAGVLPIKIDIPEEGRLYRFSKLLVTENESTWLSLNFIKIIKHLRSLFRFVVFVIVFIIAIAAARKILRLFKPAAKP